MNSIYMDETNRIPCHRIISIWGVCPIRSVDSGLYVSWHFNAADRSCQWIHSYCIDDIKFHL